MMLLLGELKVAVRHLLKSPAFTLTAVLMLALGIGATTAIFSLVEGVLLRPLPFAEPDRLVVLTDTLEGAGADDEVGVTIPDIRNYVRETHSFSSLGGYQQAAYELSGMGEPAMVNGTRMTGGVFPALGVAPLMGRYLGEHDDGVAVLSYSAWQARFQGEVTVLGKKVLLDRRPFIIVGVMPRNFEFPLAPGHLSRSELWVPYNFTEQELAATSAANWNSSMVGRLKPGISIAEANADAERVAAETVQHYPAFMAGFKIHALLQPLHEHAVQSARPLIRTLFLAVAVVLLIVCANLAGLLLVRAIGRRREFAVRLALGARAAALLRPALLESLTLSLAGGVLGLALAAVALKTGVSLLPETLPRVSEIGLDGLVAGFALGLAVITGAICSLAPGFAAIRTSVNDTLKEGGRTGTSGSAHAALRSALVIAEVAVALVLLTASGLLLRSFEKMRQVDVGYQPDHILVAAYNLPHDQYATQSSVDQFNHELLERLRTMPGVTHAGLTDSLPSSETGSSGFIPEGYVAPKESSLNLATTIGVQGDYFQAMRIRLLRGRFFTPADNERGQLVVVVNRKLAEQSWPGQEAVGKRLRVGTQSMDTPWSTVVGVVADVKEGSPDQPGNQQFYIPVAQEKLLIGSLASPTLLEANSGFIVVRTAMPPQLLIATLRQTVQTLDAQLPLTKMQTMEDALAGTEAPRRFNTALISIFAGTALLLAVLGVYSVIAFSVAARAQELAVRMALGCQRIGIVRLVLASGAKLAVAGCFLGILGAAGAARLLRSLLFGVSALDPIVLLLSSLFVLLLTLIACVLPAGRAASIDPIQSLRGE